ncbi:hypothetical protein K443DRAFT_113412 [Laccaria amethystina LaAM-08-1]|uniref:Uncharacterized protein n=1 Tax=Laccaria amethystina LaAM-08-1 TaxID=1095629 RepID=A0A0C9X4I8_9AGAR|nr:hypothetical protein K443DRAFT_113412 [Laccaria amethystina LaAM-08-1]
MGYGRFMGYAMHFPMNQLGGPKMLWGLRGYGFSEVWVKRGSTVDMSGCSVGHPAIAVHGLHVCKPHS